MTTSLKIRILLFLLSLSFAVTALTLNLTFHKEDILQSDAKEIESNLHAKEKFINDFLGNAETFEALKTVHKNRVLAEKLIPNLRDGHKIFLYTYSNHELLFWGANRIIPPTDAGLKDGSTFITDRTGFFEAIKKTQGNFSAVCYIPIKQRYPIENEYLQNTFTTDLIATNHLDIAGLNDLPSYNIRNIQGKYLFPVKLKTGAEHTYYSRLELWAWLLSIFTAFLFINYLCSWIAGKGRIKTAIGLFFVLFLVFRIITLRYNWLSMHFALKMFSSSYFAPNFFFPTLGDFLINTLCATWFLFFAYRYRSKINFSPLPAGKMISYIIFASLGLIIALLAWQVNDVFHSLILNTNINFDLTNIINLDALSWVGILVLCISVLNIYLLIDIVLAVGKTLSLNNLDRLAIFLSGIIVMLVIKISIDDVNVLFLLFAAIIFIRGWGIYKSNDEFNMGLTVTTVLIFAVICSAKLAEFQNQKELEERKAISKKLERTDDPNAEASFREIENQIASDDDIVRALQNGLQGDALLKNKLKKFYFDGYLSQFEFTVATNRPGADNASSDSTKTIAKLKQLVVSGAIKISKYFYHVSNTFGSRDYFAIVPVERNGMTLGTLFIELQSETFYNPGKFPRFLTDGKFENNQSYKPYSFAYYKDDRLVGQYGKYIFNLINYDFSGKLKRFVFTERKEHSHLLYKPNKRLLIVVSRPDTNLVMRLASVSFLFLMLLAFATICVIIAWLWRNFASNSNKMRNFRWSVLVSSNRVLYRTRIQASMVAAVVTTLVLVGVITYLSISRQYLEQQQQTIIENINKIAVGFEKKMFTNGEPLINEQAFNAFADFNAVDLSYFDVNGELKYTTQPKIYEYELLARRVNALAYVYLNNIQQSEYLNGEEKVGRLVYMAAYKPIRNSENETVGYLALPYFSNVHDFEERIGLFLNTLVNVYALVFVAIGFFAVFVANQITAPLTLVQKSLSQTKIGRKNEPIVWKRNDEIGNLVREYNNMIAALEESATRLASSERETAWKEMAKQVAHEIKNPLTPLKLGVQLLDKSWREKDPNFDKKFEKFSKSFIEQIESLSHIASEFSNFAKMPETSLENVLLREVIERCIEVYSKVENVSIVLDDNLGAEKMIRGDKDQLLRCFNNLIKNGIEAIPENRQGVIRITVDQQDQHAHVNISDNGKGIPEGLRERIFNPNFTTKSSGTGLGLAFVKQAIGNMAGSIRFTTEQDVGTTFYITLPLA